MTFTRLFSLKTSQFDDVVSRLSSKS